MVEPRAKPPIINARRELGRGRRLVSDVATLLVWIGWILLWIPAFRVAFRSLREAHRRLESGSTVGKLTLAGW